MSKDIVGIDISDYSIEAVSLEKKHNGFKVHGYSRVRLSPDIVRDGQIVDSDRLIEAIKVLFKNAQPQSLQPKAVALSIPESKVFSTIVAVPDSIKEKDLPSAISSKASEIIPESPENLLPSFRIVDKKNGFVEALYAAARKDIVEEYTKLFLSLGLEIEVVTTEAISSYAGLHPDHKKNLTLLLDIGSRTTIATIFDDHSIRDTINIGIAGNDITASLQKKLGISFEEAEERKLQDGMQAGVNDGEMMLIAQGALQPVVDELKKFVNYFEQDSGQKLQQLVLIGGTAQMSGVESYFGSNLNLPVAIGKSFLTEVSQKDLVDSTKFINAIGLARLASEKSHIDFRYERKKSEEKSSEKKVKKSKLGIWKWLVPAVLVIAIVALGYVYRERFFGQYLQTSLPLHGEVTVGLANPDGIPNFVTGVYQDINVPLAGEIAEGDYSAVLYNLQKQAETQFLAGLNTEYSKDGFYLIPQVISSQLTTVSQSEENYDPSLPMDIVVKFRVMSVSIDLVKQKLISGLDQKEQSKVMTWISMSESFELTSFNQGANTSLLKASIILEKP